MKNFFLERWLKPSFFLLSLSLTFQGFAQVATDPKETALEGVNISRVEAVRRQETLIHAQLLIKEAEETLEKGDYKKALTLFEDAQKKMSVAPASATEVSRIRRGTSICYFQLAKEAYANKDFAQAMEDAQRAYELDSENRDAFTLAENASRENNVIEAQKAKEEKATAEMPKEISNAEFVAKQKKALELFRASENYYKSEQFDEAESALKELLRLDPYSATAYHRLREVELAKYKKLGAAKQQTEAQSMLAVQEAWKLPSRRDKSVTPIKTGAPEGEDSSLGGKVGIMKKLNSIIIKKIELENTPVLSAINYLVNESREADPAKDGVNIIPTFEKGRSSSPTNTGEATGVNAATASLPSSRTVTLNLRNVPLLQAIKFLTQVTGLKYRIEPEAVMIIPEGEVEGRVQTRYFNVPAGVFNTGVEKSEEKREAGGGGRGGAGGFVGIAPAMKTRGTDVKRTFEDFGIQFPEGTGISYNEPLGILVATHTNDVLDQIEQIILRIVKTPAQVQIETKFIDVQQKDLDELGFRWALGPNSRQKWVIESGQGTSLSSFANHGGATNGPYLGAANQYAGTRGAQTAGLAGALDAVLAGAATGGTSGLVSAGANTALTVSGVLTNPQVQLMVDALARKGFTNLLSAPRVTTTSGETAKVLIAREYIYPSTYTDPQVSTGTSTGASTSGAAVVGPTPSGFVTREIGVVLEVKPTVSTDSYTINMTVSPVVTDFEGNVTYNSFAQIGTNAVITFSLVQPVFNKRSLNTSVVIWDGQTVVLGGLIREDITKVNDKIPILGDIPYLGRLFQSKLESTSKRNLMIFLTARIVDPAGNPVNKMQDGRIETLTGAATQPTATP